MHRFYLISPLDTLDKNVVAGLFLYKNDTKEIDIEFSKWGNASSGFNAQYVVQPADNPGNLERFSMELSGNYTTHYINWSSSSIQFKSIYGHYEEPPEPWYEIHQWLYTGNDIPQQEENLTIHINLWLYQGNPPSDGQEVEVILADADLPQAPPSQPSNPSPPDGAANVAANVNLSWSGGDPDVAGTVTYDVYFGTSSSPPFKATIGPYPATQSPITYAPGTLAYNTTYYWQIVATDNHDASTAGPVWTFTTAKASRCFIATAAYGTPMAEEVQILREFRDEYMLSNPLGRAFVDFYYRVSPPIAEFITEHPSLKPIVRAGLVPAVAMSIVAINTTPAEKAAIIGLLALVSVAVAIWTKRRRDRDPKHTSLG
jgi:hypothetical protein